MGVWSNRDPTIAYYKRPISNSPNQPSPMRNPHQGPRGGEIRPSYTRYHPDLGHSYQGNDTRSR